jgi:hypothetical protein
MWKYWIKNWVCWAQLEGKKPDSIVRSRGNKMSTRHCRMRRETREEETETQAQGGDDFGLSDDYEVI